MLAQIASVALPKQLTARHDKQLLKLLVVTLGLSQLHHLILEIFQKLFKNFSKVRIILTPINHLSIINFPFKKKLFFK